MTDMEQLEVPAPKGDAPLVQIFEGALLAAAKPMTVAQLAELFDDDERPETDEIRAALDDLAQSCEGRGFELREVASGFRFQVRQSLSPWIARLSQERPQKYSRALLETLALIAYRQPITRGEIEEIRGVAVSSNIVKTLQEREWVRVVGHRDVPGRPAMYATTKQFLDYFNLKTLDQLPALAEIRDLETLTAELGFTDLNLEADMPDTDTDGEDAGDTDGTVDGNESSSNTINEKANETSAQAAEHNSEADEASADEADTDGKRISEYSADNDVKAPYSQFQASIDSDTDVVEVPDEFESLSQHSQEGERSE